MLFYWHIPSFLVFWVSMKTTLEIPDKLYREIKIRAARDGVKMKDIVAEALTATLNSPAPSAHKPARKKNPFPMLHGPVGPLLAGKDIRSLSFLDEQDDLERYQRAFRR